MVQTRKRVGVGRRYVTKRENNKEEGKEIVVIWKPV